MPVYEYKAVDRGGAVVGGALDAPNRQDLFRQLDGRGLSAVSVREPAGRSPGGAATRTALWKRNRVPQRAIHHFTHLLSSLLRAGIPLSRALQTLHREAEGAAQVTWKALHDLVADGWPLADAMAQQQGVFGAVYVAMVRAGEMGGFLDVVLEQIADFQLRERDLRSRVVAALVYPIVLLTLALGVLVFLLVFFIPRFKAIFEDFEAALPLLTRIIVQVSEWAQQYGLFVLAAVCLAAFAARQWLHTEQGRRERDRRVLTLPLLGALMASFAMTRFCRMLGTLLGSGVPLVSSLRVSRESLGNQTLIDMLDSAMGRVQRGERLTDSLRDCPQLFPGSVLEIVSVAEETGCLDKEFVRIADSTEKELDHRLRTAVAMAEPVILFLIAALIGVIFIGMVLPIFSLQDYIN
ncbi:MAG: type II secretion system F family protein [Candidatus Hydrogenedentes bacterium]|nr:type II secretion system F family protein [Candidatus Hydrogenedentota bacterium]